MTGPGVNTVTSLSGRSLTTKLSTSFTEKEIHKTHCVSDSNDMISTAGPYSRCHTPGLNQMTINKKLETCNINRNTKTSITPELITKTPGDLNLKAVTNKPVASGLTMKSTENGTPGSEGNPMKPLTPGTPMSSKSHGTPFGDRRSWTPRALSSTTSCATSVSLRAYFAGDTVENLFPGVKIGKLNLAKTSLNIIDGYPESKNCSDRPNIYAFCKIRY